ncbi:MAG: hypothetical protein FWB88_01770 [Defluviitaleaceae bacterium]|nr:hypothetical protein [Defluviitaleaceae bacterium]MCL2239450.1 hypothetical protein [Defluviitaleaceae bacterium]
METHLHPQAKQQDKANYDKIQLLRLNNLALANGLITQEVKQKVERQIWSK